MALLFDNRSLLFAAKRKVGHVRELITWKIFVQTSKFFLYFDARLSYIHLISISNENNECLLRFLSFILWQPIVSVCRETKGFTFKSWTFNHLCTGYSDNSNVIWYKFYSNFSRFYVHFTDIFHIFTIWFYYGTFEAWFNLPYPVYICIFTLIWIRNEWNTLK